MPFRSGFVSIIGRPNAGKSTLLNALVGEKVAIVTKKPQTTRNRILGMVNVKAKKGHHAGQIIFIDTPGVHKPASQLSRRMMQEVHDALEGRDLILLIIDATQKFGTGDEFVLDLVKRSGMPAVPIRTRPLEDVNDTLNDLRAGKIVGRVVLTPAA